MKPFPIKPVVLALSVAAAAGPVLAEFGAKPRSALNLPEKSAITLVNQALGLVAAMVDQQGCDSAAGSYSFSARASHDGAGQATVDDRIIAVAVQDDDDLATSFRTSTVGRGEVADSDVRNLDGVFVYLAESGKLYADARFDVQVVGRSGVEPYGERLSKDLGADTAEGRLVTVTDQGYEVVASQTLPPAKWKQELAYRRPDGKLGALSVNKVPVATENTATCSIRFANAVVDNMGGGLQVEGNVRVELQ